MAGTEEVESTLLMLNECFVYKIKPRTTAAGYKAAEWLPNDCVWKGKLVIVAKGEKCIIRLIDSKTGDLYAQCPVTPTSVEPVIDSSRYFVLRIEDEKNGRHAFIGMGFTERNEAFDFNATLQDHDRRIIAEKELKKKREEESKLPPKDYSIPQGQTIHVNIKALGSAGSGQQPMLDIGQPAGGGMLLPPPTASSRHRGGAVQQQQQPLQLQQQTQQQQKALLQAQLQQLSQPVQPTYSNLTGLGMGAQGMQGMQMQMPGVQMQGMQGMQMQGMQMAGPGMGAAQLQNAGASPWWSEFKSAPATTQASQPQASQPQVQQQFSLL